MEMEVINAIFEGWYVVSIIVLYGLAIIGSLKLFSWLREVHIEARDRKKAINEARARLQKKWGVR